MRRGEEQRERAGHEVDFAPTVRATDEGLPRMHEGFERIVTTMYALDISGTYERVRDGLRLPVSAERASRDELRRDLCAAEDRAREAHLLYSNARVALEEWEADCEVAATHLRQEAQSRLAEEKVAGRHPKAITNGDVEAEMARAHPDEFRRQRVGREKRKRMVDHLERLADLWRVRRSSLEALLASARGA